MYPSRRQSSPLLCGDTGALRHGPAHCSAWCCAMPVTIPPCVCGAPLGPPCTHLHHLCLSICAFYLLLWFVSAWLSPGLWHSVVPVTGTTDPSTSCSAAIQQQPISNILLQSRHFWPFFKRQESHYATNKSHSALCQSYHAKKPDRQKNGSLADIKRKFLPLRQILPVHTQQIS